MLEGEKGPRTVAASDFFTGPNKDPERENQLQPGEVLTEIRVPAAAGWRSAYDEVRERAAFDWPLVAAAAAVKIEAGVVKEARVVLGAVAPVPWRSAARGAGPGRQGRSTTPRPRPPRRAATWGRHPSPTTGTRSACVQTLVRRTLLGLAS